jgi:hypothetical protein
VNQPKASLKPHLSEIRAWVAEGRTDIWIAHVLNSTPASISAFRSANGILRRNVPGEARGSAIPPPVIPPDAPAPEPAAPRRRRRTRAAGGTAKPAEAKRSEANPVAAAKAPAKSATAAAGASDDTAAEAEEKAGRRRRRGGRGRGRRGQQHVFEAVLDHGDEGYGFWIDGAVRDDSVFTEHWAQRRAIVVKIEADQIVIRPAEPGE